MTAVDFTLYTVSGISELCPPLGLHMPKSVTSMKAMQSKNGQPLGLCPLRHVRLPAPDVVDAVHVVTTYPVEHEVEDSDVRGPRASAEEPLEPVPRRWVRLAHEEHKQRLFRREQVAGGANLVRELG